MARIVRGGLIQCKNPIDDESVAVATIKKKAFEAHLPMIEDAGKKGVQILCLQEIFDGPYFCPSQSVRWYDAAESVPGPTTEALSPIARKYGMSIVVPVYEREQAGIYYNTAAVLDADGTYLGKYRKNHIPDCNPGFYEKFYFKPGNLGYPVFKTKHGVVGVYICYDRHFPEGARILGLRGAEIVFNPSATVAGLSEYLWKLEQPAHAVANGYFLGAINRVGTEAPWNIGEFYGQSYFVDPRGQFLATASRDKSELITADMDFAQIEEVRRVWAFYRDRRPDSYEELTKPFPLTGDTMRTLIQGGTVVTAVDTFAADVLIDHGIVTALLHPTHGERPSVDRVIDAKGKYVMPGGIDGHTHLDMPFGGTTSSDDFETGTIAAAHGGTTTIVDFAIQQRGTALREGLDTWYSKAEGKAAIDYGFHMIVTDVNTSTLAEMGTLVSEGITSFKLFMAYPGVLYVDDGQIVRAMQRAGELGGLICMHAENGIAIDVLVEQAIARGETAPKFHSLSRPQIAEAEGTNRALCLAEMVGAPVYMVHLSAPRALDRVVEARDRGLPAYAETCPQYLFCSFDDLARDGFEGAKYVCTPPLRPKEMQADLWRGLKTNDLQVVSTDHCPFCMKGQKELGKDSFAKIPNGMPGVETRLYLLWDGGVRTGKLSMNRFVEITSTAPAKIFGLYPRKGTVAVGVDADLVVWDPNKEHMLDHANMHMRVDYSPYEGRSVIGAPTHVLSRGEVIVDHGVWKGKTGRGQFVKRSTFGL
jgi:dihydropyrimidinase